MAPRLPRFVVPVPPPAPEPSPPTLPRLLPAAPVAARPCGDFANWWFDLKCSGCRRSCGYPLPLLRERRYCRNETNVLLVARRFRCEACGSRPNHVALCERIDRLPGIMHGRGPDSVVYDLTALLGGETDPYLAENPRTRILG